MPNRTAKIGHLKKKIADSAQRRSPQLVGMERSLEAFLRALQKGDVPLTAKHVCALLSLELDDLRKATLLSLMVRLAGKCKFDPIASYILHNREVFVTSRGARLGETRG